MWALKLCLINIPGVAKNKEISIFYKSNIKISPTTFRHLYTRSRTTKNFQAGNAPKSNIMTT